MGCCCSCTRTLVSKKKVRTQDKTANGSVDLDFVMVHKQVACMGFPAVGVEAWYRNPHDEVKKYLDYRFQDQYMVYNLCSEKEHVYDAQRFDGRVAYFPFPDHHACPLAMIPSFVQHALAYLSGDAQRVAAIHCKAGKGRTGLMACCLLMELDAKLSNAADVIAYYGKSRTTDGKGLTIPSQIRYVQYYEQLRLLSNGQMPTVVPSVDVSAITIRGILLKLRCDELTFRHSDGRELCIDIRENAEGSVPRIRTGKGDLTIDVSKCEFFYHLKGDVRLDFHSSRGDKKWVAALSFHTLFLKKAYGCAEIDKLYKKQDELPQDAGILFDFMEVIERV